MKATNGDTFLGGEDFDMRIVAYLADEFQKEQGIDLRKDKLALQRLKEAAEGQIELSNSTQTEVNLPSSPRTRAGKHLQVKISGPSSKRWSRISCSARSSRASMRSRMPGSRLPRSTRSCWWAA